VVVDGCLTDLLPVLRSLIALLCYPNDASIVKMHASSTPAHSSDKILEAQISGESYFNRFVVSEFEISRKPKLFKRMFVFCVVRIGEKLVRQMVRRRTKKTV
jgi:hypothetical protein